MRCGLGFLLLGLLPPAFLAVAGVVAGQEPDGKADSIERLIEQLGSARIVVREKASLKLQKRDDALPALRQALKSSDLEIAMRVQWLIDAFYKRQAKRALENLAAGKSEVMIDQLIDELVLPGEDLSNQAWGSLRDFARTLSERTAKEAKRPFTFPRFVTWGGRMRSKAVKN
jgi:hypothetical protein